MSIIWILLVCLICLYLYDRTEGFICSKQLDDYPRYVKITPYGGVEYVSNNSPPDTVQIPCHNLYQNEVDNSSNGATCWL